MKYSFYLFLPILLFFSGCLKEKSNECNINKSANDTSYGSIPGENSWDVYLPKDQSQPTNAVIIIHGGSWSFGDKNEIHCSIISMLCNELGLAVFNINYRLVSSRNNLFPAQMEDIQQAIDSISSNLAKFNVQPDHFAVIGLSAGAQLALLYSYAYNGDRKIKAVVDISGPVDFTSIGIRGNSINRIVENYLGFNYVDNPFLWEDASPYFHLTAHTGIPTLIFHGLNDALVPYTESYKLADKLKNIGVSYKLVTYPNEGHGFSYTAGKDVISKIKEWLPVFLK